MAYPGFMMVVYTDEDVENWTRYKAFEEIKIPENIKLIDERIFPEEV